MRIARLVAIVAILGTTAACYHATVETGLAPSTTKVEEGWAAGWIFGLVPPSTVSTAAQCPGGVAKVETYHSFLNMVVQALTGGIFTPMTIVATCASGAHADAATAIRVPARADGAAVAQAFELAARRASETHRDAYVVFEP